MMIAMVMATACNAFAVDIGLPISNFYDQQYEGTGTWTSNTGETGQYESRISFSNNVMTFNNTSDGETSELSINFQFTAPGQFDIYYDANLIGAGSCSDILPLTCQLNYTFGNLFIISETLQFLSGIDGLVRSGSGRLLGQYLSWKENLKATPAL